MCKWTWGEGCSKSTVLKAEHLSGRFPTDILPIHFLDVVPPRWLGPQAECEQIGRRFSSCIPGRLNDGRDCVGLLWKKQTGTSSPLKYAKRLTQFLSDSRACKVSGNRKKNWTL